MSKLPITVACAPYDRVQAIRDGRVQVEGCDVNFLTVGPEELFYRAFTNTEFDVCELSMSSYLISLSRKTNAYTAVPVFLSRVFRHSAIYVTRDGGIARPEDLRGKKVGVPEYQVTAALWVRGLLDQEYGIKPSDMRWYRGGLNQPGRTEKISLTLPSDIVIEDIPADQTLDVMLGEGRIDALITPRAPLSISQADPPVRLLFENYPELERDYFQRTGIFPIMHVLGIRSELVAEHPWLASSVVEAFRTAKDLAVRAMSDVSALHFTLPWLGSHLKETRAAMGEDYWPYGVEANRVTLTAMLDFAHRHGTTERRLDVEELFARSTIGRFKV